VSDTFARMYDAGPFDPNRREDAIAENARRMLLTVAHETAIYERLATNDELTHLLGGLIVGVVQLMQAIYVPGDQSDAAIRSAIMQMTPWAVDMSRAQQGKEPLGTA